MESIETERVREWMEQAVLGLGLCPFAAEPWQAGRVRLVVSQAKSEDTLLGDLHSEVTQLVGTDPASIETTLLIIPHLLQDFADYNQFLDLAEALIEVNGWCGIFQVASFHPAYQFADTEPDDPSNLTNCSPYPILHVLRESSITRALENYPDPDQVPATNIQTLRDLSEERRRQIFGR